jgi:hypothetical protein
MDITLSVDEESYSYHVEDDSSREQIDFLDAVMGFECVMRAAFPLFECHHLLVMCPDGEIHEGIDEDAPPLDDKDKKEPDADGGINLGKKE